MRVGFDASAAATPRPTGVGVAVGSAARALADRGVEVRCRWSRWRRRRWVPTRCGVFHDRWSVWGRRLDVFHGPDTRLPRFEGPVWVATVHDLSARRAGFAGERFRALREAHWAAAAARARVVVTYTEAVKAEVVAGLGVDPAAVAVVPLAPAEGVELPGVEAAEERLRGVVEGAFVLVVGERSRRKNTTGAVAAFAAAGLGPEVSLVLAGPAGRGAEEVEEAIGRSGVGDRVRVLDYVSPDVLGALWVRARALLFPSRYEGFGIPVLEAFRAGVPVVASRDPSLVEVSGGAALHAEAEDAEGLGERLREAVEGGAVWVARGRERVREFGWERVGRELMAVYERAAGGGR